MKKLVLLGISVCLFAGINLFTSCNETPKETTEQSEIEEVEPSQPSSDEQQLNNDSTEKIVKIEHRKIVSTPKGKNSNLAKSSKQTDPAEVEITEDYSKTQPENVSNYEGYVDLGLASGTYWKEQNEDGGLYTYEQAVKTFGHLPIKVQWEELKDNCKWQWTGNGYKVTGPNGKSITLPATGNFLCNGGVFGVGSHGGYWSSSSEQSEFANYLYFDSGSVDIYENYRCYGRSVRLCKKNERKYRYYGGN